MIPRNSWKARNKMWIWKYENKEFKFKNKKQMLDFMVDNNDWSYWEAKNVAEHESYEVK